MRWTRQSYARDGIAGRVMSPWAINSTRTRDDAADGEVVWSWRPDAGVKFADVVSALPGADTTLVRKRRWQNSRHRGEREI